MHAAPPRALADVLVLPAQRAATFSAEGGPAPELPPGARRVVSLTMGSGRPLPRPRPEHTARTESPVGRANARLGIISAEPFAPRPPEREHVDRQVLVADVHAKLAHFSAAAPPGMTGPALLPFLAACLVDTGWVVP